MSYGRDRRGGGSSARPGGGGAGVGTPGKHSLTEGMSRRSAVQLKPASGVDADLRRREREAVSLDRPASESWEESRATIDLDSVSDVLSDAAAARAARKNPRMQMRLGFDPAAFSSAAIDSVDFAQDVGRTQKKHGIRPDGVAGPRTCQLAGVALGGQRHKPIGDDLMTPDWNASGRRPSGGHDGRGDNTLEPDWNASGRRPSGGHDGRGDNTLEPDWSSSGRRPSGGHDGRGDNTLEPDWSSSERRPGGVHDGHGDNTLEPDWND